MYRRWSTVIGSNAQRNYQLKQLEERVKRRQVRCRLLDSVEIAVDCCAEFIGRERGRREGTRPLLDWGGMGSRWS